MQFEKTVQEGLRKGMLYCYS